MFSRQHSMKSFHVVVLQRTAKKCTKNFNARAQPLFCSLIILFSDVLVAVVVVVSSTPQYYSAERNWKVDYKRSIRTAQVVGRKRFYQKIGWRHPLHSFVDQIRVTSIIVCWLTALSKHWNNFATMLRIFNKAFPLKWPAPMHIDWKKRKCLYKKIVYLQQVGLVWDTKVMAAPMSCESIVFIMKFWLYFQSLFSSDLEIAIVLKRYL